MNESALGPAQQIDLVPTQTWALSPRLHTYLCLGMAWHLPRKGSRRCVREGWGQVQTGGGLWQHLVHEAVPYPGLWTAGNKPHPTLEDRLTPSPM